MKQLAELAIAINVLMLTLASFNIEDRIDTLEKQNKDLIVKVDSLLKTNNK